VRGARGAATFNGRLLLGRCTLALAASAYLLVVACGSNGSTGGDGLPARVDAGNPAGEAGATGPEDASNLGEDSSNAWHDGPDSSLTVTAPTNDGGQGSSPFGAPLAIPAAGGSGAHLVTVGSTNRLELHGVVVWGIEDFATGSFAADQHTNRDAIIANVAAWGGNVIRLRVLADEYVHLTLMGSDANYLQWIKDWVAAAEAQGLYVQICWWDSLDSQNDKNDANWATQYAYAFPMMTDVHNALKLADGSDDPKVFYEPFNEPNNVSWDQWLPAMKATVAQFRQTEGYQGFLTIDTTTWSHDYSDTYMGELEAYDATLTSSGQSNLAFARHDYCDDYGNNFTGAAWIANTGASETAHVMYETEYGNYNGPGVQSDAWSAAITSYFKTDLFDRSNVAGADAFLFGNWYDANAMSSDPSGDTLTAWGSDVQNWLGAYK
jgi:Cellulase (glycosyl hydrolase family 5)